MRRIAFVVVAAWAAATGAFVLAHLAPGGPAVALGGEYGAAGYREEVEKSYGLDRPLPEIYVDYLVKVFGGDLGRSYRAHAPVLDLIAEALPVTLALMIPTVILAALLGTMLGFFTVPGKASSGRFFSACLAGVHAAPAYLVGQAFVLVLAVWWALFPVQGLGAHYGEAVGAWTTVKTWSYHLVLPVATLTMQQLAFYALLARARLAEEIRLPYMTTALMKGCSPLKARWRHAFPNALLPLVAVFGSRIGGAIGGAVIIETLFALPGLGRLAVTSALGRDHPVIIGIVLFAFLAMALANLLADLVALWLNPRLRDQPA